MQTDNLIARINSMSALDDYASQKPANQNQSQTISFEELLQKELDNKEKLTFSKHAEARMTQREMQLSDTDIEKLSKAVDKAEQKGVQNTLVLMDQMAFIVNVPSNVVITAMNGQDLKENIFTQIDGAVIV